MTDALMTEPIKTRFCDECKPSAAGGQYITYVCSNPNSRYYGQRVSSRIRQKCAEQGVIQGNKRKRTPAQRATNLGDESSENRKPPNIIRRVITYTEAVVEWTAAGRPERSDEEVTFIFSNFCEPCKWFNPRHNICRECGCRVANNGFTITNKIKMATQHCPKKKW